MYRIKVSHLRTFSENDCRDIPAWWNSVEGFITLIRNDSTLYARKEDAQKDLNWFNTYLKTDAQTTKIVKEE